MNKKQTQKAVMREVVKLIEAEKEYHSRKDVSDRCGITEEQQEWFVKGMEQAITVIQAVPEDVDMTIEGDYSVCEAKDGNSVLLIE